MPRAVRALLAVVTSVLYILSFPNFNLSWLAWIALIPLLYGTRDCTPRSALLLGWFSGTLAYCGLLYWILPTFSAAHLSLPLAMGCLLLLAMYLGGFWALWCLFAARRPHPVFIAAAWVALEYLRTYLFSGFPWTLLGDSQYRHLATIQIASITGVYGVSFLIVWICAAAASHRKDLVLALGVTATIALAGHVRLMSAIRNAGEPRFRVALLQGNIDQYKKWDQAYVDDIKQTYERMDARAALGKPDLILWPETSVPGYLMQEPTLRDWLIGVIRRSGVRQLVGAPALNNSLAYNAAYLVSPEGQLDGFYAKQHLVPFGEIVPCSALLGRFIHVLNDLGGFTAGTTSPVLESGGVRVGVNICYEAIFPNLVRRSVAEGAELLANLTNDGWYMKTAAPYQHLIPNIFRAVENARWLVRADNTGVSAVIDPYGRIVSASPIYQAAIVTARVEPRADLTFYTRVGDLFAWLCCALSFLALIFPGRRLHA